MRKRIWNVLIIALMLVVSVTPLEGKAQDGPENVYLPLAYKNHNPLTGPQIINVPYINADPIVNKGFYEMGIFWFGKVRLDTNYTDVRIGYNDNALWIHAATFDRRLWYDPSLKSDLQTWDAATLLLHLEGSGSPARPQTQSYRFVAQMNWRLEDPNYYEAYRGNGTQWTAQQVDINSYSGWEGNSPNDSVDDRGWKMVFRIPFESLGLAGKPADGSVWRFGLLIHDRDSAAGPALVNQSWPDQLEKDTPSTWGRIRFGLPTYNTPNVKDMQTTVIRNGLNGALVQDADVGGWATCGGMSWPDFWTKWGEKNYAGQREVNVQNQQNLGDWPCFSKYFTTFPIDSIPPGKVIRSATLVMRQLGGSDPSQAFDSLIQVMRVAQGWDESTITWNNAPQVLENFSRTWVGVLHTGAGFDYCADTPSRTWDVSNAMQQAYQAGQPLRLALYSSDFAMHSGKYFYSSDSEDCSRAARPTLIIEWGDP